MRRTHAWLGLWGAVLGLLFGVSGILLNHRDILKIPAAKIEQHELQLPLPEPHPSYPKALAAWLGQTLNIDVQHAKIRREPAKTLVVMSLTGTLLWTGLHGRRIAAVGLVLTCLSLSLFFTWQAIGSSPC